MTAREVSPVHASLNLEQRDEPVLGQLTEVHLLRSLAILVFWDSGKQPKSTIPRRTVATKSSMYLREECGQVSAGDTLVNTASAWMMQHERHK